MLYLLRAQNNRDTTLRILKSAISQYHSIVFTSSGCGKRLTKTVIKTCILFFAYVRRVSVAYRIAAQSTLVVDVGKTLLAIHASTATVWARHYLAGF